MKVAAITTAYNEEKIIRGTLKCLQPFVDNHLVMLSEKPYFGTPDKTDHTEQICWEYGVDVVKGQWEEHDQRNIAVHILSDYDWLLMFDTDELMTQTDLAKLIKFLEVCTLDAVAIISKVYWKNTDYRLDPYPTHHKIIATRPTVHYHENACLDKPYALLKQDNALGIVHHHLSFAEPKDLLSKVLHYGHADEFDGQKWYDEHFKNWKPGEPAIQPNGSIWQAVYDPLPEELKCLIY